MDAAKSANLIGGKMFFNSIQLFYFSSVNWMLNALFPEISRQ